MRNRLQFSPSPILVLGLLSISGCGRLNTSLCISTTPPCTAGHAALVSALAGQRPFEPRLTGGFSYAPVARRDYPVNVDSALRHAFQRISREVEREHSPHTLHAAALRDLITNRPDTAIAHLEKAAEEDPGNGAVTSDLAAAYMVRAEAQDRPDDLVAALSLAESAAQLMPSSAEALFNRALVRQKLLLSVQAAEAWRQYLDTSAEPGWEREARSALAFLTSPGADAGWERAKASLQGGQANCDPRCRAGLATLVERFGQEARLYAEEDLLPAWATQWQSGRHHEAAKTLALTLALGRALATAHGDRMVADTAEVLDRAVVRSAVQVALLAAGLRRYGDGLAQTKARRFAAAEAPLRSAQSLLRQAGAPMELWARLLLVRCAYQRSDGTTAERLARSLLAVTDHKRYPALTARAQWVLGTTLLEMARPAEALAAYRESLALFEKLHEAGHQTALHTLLASALFELGEGAAAWQQRYLALQGLASRRDPTRLRLALTEAAFAALDAERPTAAVLLQTEALDLARQDGNPLALTTSLLNRAAILSAGTDYRRALDDLLQAQRLCPQIEDREVRESVSADLLFAKGQAELPLDPRRALAVLDQAITIYRRQNRPLLLPRALQTRAQTWRKLGDELASQADLDQAIEILERERGALHVAEQRATFLERFSTIFDDMIASQVRQGHSERALEYAERARTRLLLDWLAALPSGPVREQLELALPASLLPFSELQSRVAENVEVARYKVLPDRLLLAAIGRNSLHLATVEITAAQLSQRVHQFQHLAVAGGEPARRAAMDLYDLLLQPLAGELHGDRQLVLIPDGPLFEVPFAGLVRRANGHTLIEDRSLVVAPSLNLLVQRRGDAPKKGFAGASALLLANPAFDATLFPHLHNLNGAEREAAEIAALYPGARLVRRGEATRQALLGGLGRYRIVHFSGHALASSRAPLLSVLPLAPGGGSGDTGVLYARELFAPGSGGTDLVILSTCGSAAGTALPGEGIGGFVWPLLSRGVSTVVASLWEVDDRRAGRLLVAFHRFLAAGRSPASALRQAQLNMLAADRRDGNPYLPDWAAFQVYGAAPTPEPARSREGS